MAVDLTVFFLLSLQLSSACRPPLAHAVSTRPPRHPFAARRRPVARRRRWRFPGRRRLRRRIPPRRRRRASTSSAAVPRRAAAGSSRRSFRRAIRSSTNAFIGFTPPLPTSGSSSSSIRFSSARLVPITIARGETTLGASRHAGRLGVFRRRHPSTAESIINCPNRADELRLLFFLLRCRSQPRRCTAVTPDETPCRSCRLGVTVLGFVRSGTTGSAADDVIIDHKATDQS